MKKLITKIQTLIEDLNKSNEFYGISLDIINKIHFTVFDKTDYWLAKIVPQKSNQRIEFELYIKDVLLDKLVSKDNNEQTYAQSIIVHELFHMKEFIITNSIIPLMPIYKTCKTSTYNLLLNLGYTQWTEYYAHYNSSKYFLEKPINIKEVVELSKDAINIIEQYINQNREYQMPEVVYDAILEFISYTIKLSARYNQSSDNLFILSLESISIVYKEHYDYIFEIISYMDELYKNYPNWVSNEKFLEIGKTLFGIIHKYNIDYSTNDLSDNFILTRII